MLRPWAVFFISKLLRYNMLLILTLMWHKTKFNHGKLNFNKVIYKILDA